MNRKSAQILVVDDDPTQGAALRDLFTRAGYQVTLCSSAVQAATLAQRQEFHALVVDCMLPRMNGVDLVEEIKQVAISPPFVILYSGIFKDKNFAKAALERTGAAAFLTKPLDLTEVLDLVHGHFPEGEVEDVAAAAGPLALYGSRALDDAALIALIATEPTISGVHLPMLYRRLQASRLSGELSMVTATGDLNTISLCAGRIFSVRTPDKDSVFGGLAVSLGFVTSEDVLAATNNPARKMMGQKLIESFSLSPHAIQVVLEEQLALRLSQTIEDAVLTLDWTTRAYAAPEFALNLERFQQLSQDWTSSKLTPESIRSELMTWAEHVLSDRLGEANKAEVLGDLLQDERGDDEVVELLRELLAGNVTIGERQQAATDFRFLETRLMHLLTAYQTQNYFQVLGIGEKAQALEINRAFEELNRHFNPATLPEDCPPRLMVKAAQVFKIIEAAHHTLSDEIERHRYMLLQHNKRAQARLENEPILRAAIHQLQNGLAFEAAQTFQDLLDKRLDFPDLRAYRLWAGLICDRRYNDLTLENIPPEERHSAPYHMARGTNFRVRGDLVKALECYQAALVMDPRLTAARAEVEKTRVEIEQRGGRTLFNDVQTLFSKVRRSG